MESVFEAWERFKSLLRKCPDHKILLLDQILTFYHGITSIDRDKIMLAAGGNLMRKTPQEAYDLIENMTNHHYQWDTEVHYHSTTDLSAHHSDYIPAEIAQIEVLGNHKSYINQYFQQGLGHPNTIHFSDSNESDEDEPSEAQTLILPLSGNPTLISEPTIPDSSPSLTPVEGDDRLLEEVDAFLAEEDSISPEIDDSYLDPEGDILFLEKLLDKEPSLSLPLEKIIKDSDEFETETIMDEVHVYSPQSTAHVPPPYIPHELELKSITSITDSLLEEFSDELAHIDPIPPGDENLDFESDIRELGLLLTHDSLIDSSCPEEFSGKLTHKSHHIFTRVQSIMF
jgi:hypothetical protein